MKYEGSPFLSLSERNRIGSLAPLPTPGFELVFGKQITRGSSTAAAYTGRRRGIDPCNGKYDC